MDIEIFAIAAAFFISFAVSALFGKKIILFLRKKKMGQKILEIGPSWHKSKEGTPSMGGLIFILGTAAAMAGVGWRYVAKGQYGLLIVLFLGLCGAGIGMVDDRAKMLKKQNKGLSAIQKLMLQIAATAVFLSLIRVAGYSNSALYVPFLNATFEIHWIIYYVVSIVAVVGIMNASNLTDGVDGLNTGVTMPICIFFGLAAYMMGGAFFGVSALCAAVLGGLAAFLIFNFKPAKVFMGDTGSMFLGGVVAGLAFVLDMPLILLVACFVYVAEALSVTLQVNYFKLTGGKRIFKMSPIHHHFELCGWGEKKVFAVFTLVSVLFCALALLGIWGRFPL